ncbi:MAG: isocitrate dehydrogenase (NAD(+)) [Acidobacteria bacterium]|nr:isocitrate dehydrogenase (NAD(+)) [Acidobacteriota bacterium]
MPHTITLIPGDGIGPEISEAATLVLDAAGVELAWEPFEAGLRALEKTGNPLPPELLDSIRRNKVALKGPLTTLVGEGFPSANVSLRKQLDLYANLRPVRSLRGVPTRYSDVNLVIVRENTEDLYSGIEHVIMPGVTEALKVITSHASTRIARFAFEYAVRRNRGKVTAVHKANIMKVTDGLFLESARQVARGYPQIAFDDKIVDNLAMQLVINPNQFDVLLLSNLYGDIVSDLCAGLVGGLGLVPGANIGEEYAVFEAVHGSAPDIAGKGIANPTALILSSVLMLRHLGEDQVADRVAEACFRVLERGEVLTPDLGGKATTREYAAALVRELSLDS